MALSSASETPGAEAEAKLAQCKDVGDVQGAASAARDLAGAGVSNNQLEAAEGMLSGMMSKYKASGDKVSQGHLLAAIAEIQCVLMSSQSISTADEALKLLRGTGDAKGIAAALEALFKAHHAQNNPNAGLRAANHELETIRQSGDKTVEVNVLEMIAHAHAMLGEPVSAINAAKPALELRRMLGDKEGEGSMLHMIAEMRWANDEHAEATEVARQSLAVFTAAKCEWGKEKALATISSLLAQRGQVDKAPNRQEAVRALKDLAKALERKSADDIKSAEARLNKVRDLVTDHEIVENLSPILQKDPEAIKFLKDLGWNFGEVETLEGTYFKQYSHEAFYLMTAIGGMGFGPQFRSVYPYRLGRKRDEFYGCSIAMLPETEGWQMELGFRPGILDACLQSNGMFSYPPYPPE
mmetsp:Transcript_102710/g.257501  ORF Transcript_102710/g.257501 Transcript_102710/m.257501 type:complete len:411 (-) Transcript_102710:147-1379(-)